MAKNALTKCHLDAVHQVYKWLVGGQTEYDIRQAIAQAYPNENATPLIMAAIDQLRQATDHDPELVLGWCFEATREMYRRCVEIGDFSGALRAVKQLAQLAGKQS